MEKKTCGDSGGITLAGKPCGIHMNLSPVNGRCIQHDPLRRDVATAMREKGGKASHEARLRLIATGGECPPAPRTLKDAVGYSSWAIDALAMGRITTQTAAQIAALLREFRSALEKRSLERQVLKLREELKEAQGRRQGAR